MTFPTFVVETMMGAGPFDVAGVSYLNLTGASGSRASTPDDAAFAVTDLDIRIHLKLTDWLPDPGLNFEVVGQFDAGINQRAWLMFISSDGKLNLRWSTNGTNETDATSTAPIPFPVTGELALRITFDVDNGAAGKTATFYTSDSITGTWTQFGTAVTTAGTTSIHNSTANLGIGDVPGSGFQALAGRALAFDWRTTIGGGTAAANPDFTTQANGAASFVDAAGRTWTVNSPASIIRFDWVSQSAATAAHPNGRVVGASWSIGRDNELQPFPAGTADAELYNEDRVLDPEHTTGTYFGKLLPRVPVRFRSTHLAVGYDHYYGFVESGWVQDYKPPEDARCALRCVDMLSVLDGATLPQSAYDAVVLARRPKAFWKLDETAGTQMADSSGNGLHGRRDNGEAVDPLVFGGGKAFNAPHVGDHRGIYTGGSLPTSPPCTIEAWVNTSRDLTLTKTIVNAQRDSARGSALWLGVETSGGGSPGGELVINFLGLGTAYKARGSSRIDDGRTHHVVCTIASNAAADILLYVDGNLQTKTTISGTDGGNWTSHLWWTVANTADIGGGDFGLDGTIDEVAVYDRALTAAQIAENYAAGTTAFNGDTTGTRIGRVLDFVGVPAALRDIATGDTTLGPADYAGRSAGEYIAAVVESEQGFWHVAHHDGGKLKFRGRYARLTETRSITTQATFTDAGTPGALHYERTGLDVDPNGIASIVNVVDVEWRGGKARVVDPNGSHLPGSYGPQLRTIRTEAPTQSAAESAGNWVVARYGQPQVRVRGFDTRPDVNDDHWPAALGSRISDRVSVRRHPQVVGAAITNLVLIEGLRHQVRDKKWTVDYQLSNADDTQVWIWGTSTWDGTKVWG